MVGKRIQEKRSKRHERVNKSIDLGRMMVERFKNCKMRKLIANP